MDVCVINRDDRDYIVISLSNLGLIKKLLKILFVLYNCISLDLNVFWHRFLHQKVEFIDDEPLNCTNSHSLVQIFEACGVISSLHSCITCHLLPSLRAWPVARSLFFPGLVYLHTRNPVVVHRDIKSANVLPGR